MCVDVCRCVLPDRGFKNRHTPHLFDERGVFFRANTKNTGTFFFFSKHKLTFFLVDLKKYTQTTDNVLLCSILLLLLLLLRIIILKIQEKQNDETCLNYRRPL